MEDCVELVRQSNALIQAVGVFGGSPEDPEPALQRLVDASGDDDEASMQSHGSSLRLYFGQEYWTKFAASQRQRLCQLEQLLEEEKSKALWADHDSSANAGEVISAEIFEMRLIERVMRECYVEEQCCEEELVCAGRVLERTLVDREEVLAAMREQDPQHGPPGHAHEQLGTE